MARKRTSETEIAVSQSAAAAAPARRKTAASQHKKRSPASPVVEPLAESVTAPVTAAYEPTHEDIAALAYSYWVERGCQGGSPEEDWLRAERELGLAAAAVNA